MKAQSIENQMKKLKPMHANAKAFLEKFEQPSLLPRAGVPLNRKVEEATTKQVSTATAQQERTPPKVSLANPIQEKPAIKPAVKKPAVKAPTKKPVAAKSVAAKPAAKPRVKTTK